MEIGGRCMLFKICPVGDDDQAVAQHDSGILLKVS